MTSFTGNKQLSNSNTSLENSTINTELNDLSLKSIAQLLFSIITAESTKGLKFEYMRRRDGSYQIDLKSSSFDSVFSVSSQSVYIS